MLDYRTRNWLSWIAFVVAVVLAIIAVAFMVEVLSW